MFDRRQLEYAFFKNNPVVILVIDPDTGDIIDANTAAIQFYGYEEVLLRKMNIHQINQSPMEVIKSELINSAREESIFFIFEHKLASGIVKQVEITTTPIEIDGKIVIYSMVNELTSKYSCSNRIARSKHVAEQDKKVSEKIMEDQKISFEALFKNSPIAIVQFDEGHRAMRINDAFTSLFGFTQHEIVGAEIDACLSNDETFSEMRNYTSKVFNGESLSAFGVRTAKNGDKIDVNIVGIPIIIEGRVVGGYTIYTDIRNDLTIKRELMVSKEEAESANLAKSNFLANMSHEIRTPMNGFIGVLKLLEDTPLNFQQKKYLQLADNSAKSLLKLVSDILDYSKIESSQLKLENTTFDIYQLLDETISLYRPLAFQKNLTLKCHFGKGLHSIWEGDEFRIKQVLSNLISNAIKYTNQGEILVKICLNEQITPECFMLKFEVHDTGIGIAMEKKDLLFKRFSQVHENNEKFYGGTGLGLAISKGIVDMMYGDITLETSTSSGSCFSFTCLLKSSDSSDHGSLINENFERTDTVLTSKKMLVADDDEISRFVIERLAIAKGWDVTIAENGLKAVALCENTKFDVILMDCQMPLLNGFEATMKIRAESPLNNLTPIIALTAFSKEENEDRCFLAGMDDYYSKPIDFNALFVKIQSL